MALLGEHLLAWRKEKHLSQTALALAAGLAQSTLCDLECNRIDPTLGTVRRLAAALGISIGTLVEQKPAAAILDRHQLDRIARRALKLSRHRLSLWEEHLANALARHSKSRLQAAGLPVRHSAGSRAHIHRHLQAEVGAIQWQALEQRLQKLLSQHPFPHATQRH